VTVQTARVSVDNSTQFHSLNFETGGVFTVQNLGPSVVYIGPVTAGDSSSTVDLDGAYPLVPGASVQVPDSSTSGEDTTVIGWNTPSSDETGTETAIITLLGILGGE
jgi:hypothetical protein